MAIPEGLPVPTRTALVVEDEHSTLRFYMTGLRGLREFRLLSAENGLEALEVLRSTRVDVVVTDLNMPVMDGYSLIAELDRRYPSLPVIVITSVEDASLRTEALELGALRVIPKPPKLSMLMETIRSAAGRVTPGLVRGLGLSSILQLMNWERRSASLTVKGHTETGYLYVQDGNLIHAALGREEGIIAAYRILGWDIQEVEFVHACKVEATIDLPLQEILMNLAVFRDQKAKTPVPPRRDEPDVWGA
jgi:CheY-like chemotaxis protein